MPNKCIENYTLEELKAMFPNIPYENTEIAYAFFHRGRKSVETVCANFSISKSTLYRYVNSIKEAFSNSKGQL